MDDLHSLSLFFYRLIWSSRSSQYLVYLHICIALRLFLVFAYMLSLALWIGLALSSFLFLLLGLDVAFDIS